MFFHYSMLKCAFHPPWWIQYKLTSWSFFVHISPLLYTAVDLIVRQDCGFSSSYPLSFCSTCSDYRGILYRWNTKMKLVFICKCNGLNKAQNKVKLPQRLPVVIVCWIYWLCLDDAKSSFLQNGTRVYAVDSQVTFKINRHVYI